MGFTAAAVAISAGAGLAQTYSSYQASKAAEQRAKYDATMQERQANEEKETAKENLRRKRDDRNRYLAQVALSQTASGFESSTGTPLEVLGDITNRLDEDIYDYGEAAMARVSQLRAGAQMSRYTGKQIAKARPLQLFGNLLQTGASSYSAYSRAANMKSPNE